MEKLLHFCRDECLSRVLFARISCVLVFLCFMFVLFFLLDCKNFPKQVREVRKIFD